MEKVQKVALKDGRELVIRPALPDDSCSIIDTVRSNAMERSYVLMDHYGKDVESEKAYIAGLDARKELLIVADLDHDVVGCLAALQADAGRRPETAHIAQVGLHIREQFRGLGIGPHLLGQCVSWAREMGYKKLEANIFTTNQRSLSLFKKAGFVEEGVRQNRIHVGGMFISEVLMGKVL
jgi:RimJ/RimL family protein N-acetyltransferase